MVQRLFVMGVLLLPTLVIADIAEAKGPRDVGPPDHRCQRDCRLGVRSCMVEAHGQVRECRTGCGELIEAARNECEADAESDACATAREAARACLLPCRGAMFLAIPACLSAGEICRSDCPPPEGASCHRQCRARYRSCHSWARAEARLCRAACPRPPAECFKDDSASEECDAAVEARRDCAAACRDTFHEAVGECRAVKDACLADCQPHEDPGD